MSREKRKGLTVPPSELWRIPSEEPSDPEKAYRDLRERVKELNCLYGVAQLIERHADSLEDLFAALVDLLPLSWQDPERTCARVVFESSSYCSRNFRETEWRQAAPIVVEERTAGELEIFSLDDRPPEAASRFLAEEEVMLEEVARRIGAAAARLATARELQEVNRQLRVGHAALQEANTALRAVLARIEEEKQQIGREVQANVKSVVLPVLHALALQLPASKRNYAEILRKTLEEVTSPFAARLSQSHPTLSPIENTICNLIRSGLSSKEIAQLRGVSLSTVLRHREHIRQKLKLRNAKVNLASYLHALP